MKALKDIWETIRGNRQRLEDVKFLTKENIEARRVVLEKMESDAREICEGAENGENFMMNEHQAMLVARILGYKVRCGKLSDIIKYVRFVDGKFIAFKKDETIMEYQTNWMLDNYAKNWYVVD